MNVLIEKLKPYVPKFIKNFFRNIIYFREWERHTFKKSNPYINDEDEFIFEKSKIKVGIIYGTLQYHKYWISACKDLNISYRIIYLERSDWMDQVLFSGCDIFLVWPDISSQEIKLMFDERLRIMFHEMGKQIYPSLKEIWFYENKRVQHYWLKYHQYPLLETKIFYDEDEAEIFLKSTEYPIVMKSNHGASASGVYIINSYSEAIKKTKKFLKEGFLPKRNSAGKSQKGSVYFQKYLKGLKEWRMVRIGNSFFGHGKDMKGQFHSGSGKANWDLPPKGAFELLLDITKKGAFTSMDIDIFEDSDGRMYINELQTVFGNSIAKEQLKINGTAGRYVLNNNNDFIFEEGSFCQNHLCNLRLKYILECLEE